MKKILTKNKFVFRHYPFMKKNTDEKQICFSSLSFYEKIYWRKTNLFLVTILLLICYNKLWKKYWQKTNLFLVTILLWKKILTKNKFVFSHYPFMKKNTDEKQICF